MMLSEIHFLVSDFKKNEETAKLKDKEIKKIYEYDQSWNQRNAA